MAINRYVDVNFDQPVSNYVPLPLEMLYKLGKDASKDYEDTMKDMESGKDPISKLNTRTVARIYDPSQGIMVDAPIDFEDQKKGVLDYMNKQKQQIVDDYIKDKDVNKYKQRAAALKGDMISAYSDLTGKAAIVDQINKENEQLSKSEAFGLDPAYATERLHYNTDYLRNLKAGKVQAYAPPSVAKQVNMEDVIKTDTDNWYKSDLGSGYSTGDYITEVNKKGITGTRVYDYVNNAWRNPNHSARALAQLQMKHQMGLTGLSKDSEVEYQDYKTDEKGNIVLDKDKKPIIETKKGKFEDVFMEQKKREYEAALAAKLVHTDLDYNLKANPFALRALDKKDEAEAYKYLPIYESNPDSTSTNNRQALGFLGVKTDYLNDDGSVKTDDIQNISDADREYHTKRATEWLKDYKEGKLSAQNALVYGKSYLETINKINNNDLRNRYADKFKGLLKAAVAYGLLGDKQSFANYKLPDGKINYMKLEGDLVNLGKNINTSSSNVMGLQADFTPDLNRTYLGQTKVDDNGNTIFEKSPLLQKMKIYEQGDPESSSKIRQEGVDKLAQNGSIVALDFNDPNLGAMTLTATKGKDDVEPKLYTAIVPDVNLKKSMEPVHNFTQQINKTLSNKMSAEEKAKNFTIANKRILELSNEIAKSNISPQDKQNLINTLNNAFNNVSGGTNKRGVAVGETFDGRYTLIGSSNIQNGIPKKTVLRIDNTNGQFEEVELGTIQYEESAAIQAKHAPGYSEKAPGYKPSEQIYTNLPQ